MNVATSSSYNEESARQKEQRIFGELLLRLGDALLNRLFDLRPRSARSRRQYLIFLFLLSGFLISLLYYPLSVWLLYIQDVFIYFFNPAFPQNFQGNAIANIINYGILAISDPRVLQYLPIFLAPFFIALQTAASYLADIFELEDPTVAREFVTAVALSGSNETIRITQGEIYEEHRTSPTFLIGGPGKVVVDIDSAALFENPDGTTRVIGPTWKQPGGKALLDGFMRFRQAIDLRDHFIELREEGGKSAVVKSRSLDGIPITATDVRFMFSVHRGGKKSSLDDPYPFSPKAVEQLIYKATSRVTPDLSNPSTYEFSWINTMVSLIRGRLGGFMNEQKLTQYLASIGKPELERIKKQENEIAEGIKKLAPSAVEELPKAKELKPPPEFTPRYKIKNLFSQFADEFSKSQREKGVELHWIGVGTWKTPIEVVPEKHLEAWRISRENLIKGSEQAMELWRNEATVQKMMSLIQNVPVSKFPGITEKHDHSPAVRALLEEYRQQLIEEAEFLHAKNEAVPRVIIRAIEHLNDVLNFKGWHWVGPVAPEDTNLSTGRSSTVGPESNWNRSVEYVYREFIQLVGDKATADRLIDLERSQYPKETLRQLIERAREHFFRNRK